MRTERGRHRTGGRYPAPPQPAGVEWPAWLLRQPRPTGGPPSAAVAPVVGGERGGGPLPPPRPRGLQLLPITFADGGSGCQRRPQDAAVVVGTGWAAKLCTQMERVFFFFFLNEMKSHTLYSALLERPHAHQVTGRGGHTDGPKEGGRGKTVLFGAHALFPQRVDVDKVHLRLTRVCAQRGRLLLSVQHSPHLLPRFYCWHECTRICGA